MLNIILIRMYAEKYDLCDVLVFMCTVCMIFITNTNNDDDDDDDNNNNNNNNGHLHMWLAS